MYKRFCTYIDLLLIDVVCLQINKQTLHFYDEVEFRPDEAVADQAILLCTITVTTRQIIIVLLSTFVWSHYQHNGIFTNISEESDNSDC